MWVGGGGGGGEGGKTILITHLHPTQSSVLYSEFLFATLFSYSQVYQLNVDEGNRCHEGNNS